MSALASVQVALAELKGKQRAFIVTDKPLFDMGFADRVTKVLDTVNVHHQVCVCVCVCMRVRHLHHQMCAPALSEHFIPLMYSSTLPHTQTLFSPSSRSVHVGVLPRDPRPHPGLHC